MLQGDGARSQAETTRMGLLLCNTFPLRDRNHDYAVPHWYVLGSSIFSFYAVDWPSWQNTAQKGKRPDAQRITICSTSNLQSIQNCCYTDTKSQQKMLSWKNTISYQLTWKGQEESHLTLAGMRRLSSVWNRGRLKQGAPRSNVDPTAQLSFTALHNAKADIGNLNTKQFVHHPWKKPRTRLSKNKKMFYLPVVWWVNFGSIQRLIG